MKTILSIVLLLLVGFTGCQRKDCSSVLANAANLMAEHPDSVLLFAMTTASAQTTLLGTVRESKTGEAVGSVNVMLQNMARRAMYGFYTIRIIGNDYEAEGYFNI